MPGGITPAEGQAPADAAAAEQQAVLDTLIRSESDRLAAEAAARRTERDAATATMIGTGGATVTGDKLVDAPAPRTNRFSTGLQVLFASNGMYVYATVEADFTTAIPPGP